MRLSPLRPLAVAIALASAACASAPSPKAPPLAGGVHVAQGLCIGEFECDSGEWRATTALKVYARLDPASPVIATLAPGDWVSPLEGQHRIVPVRGVVRTATDLTGERLEKGDVVYRLESQGEGTYGFWRRGREYSSHWAQGDENEPITWDAEPVAADGVITGWWVRVRLDNGQIGWIRDGAFQCMNLAVEGEEGCRR